MTTASPPVSLTVYIGAANWMTPPASSSVIVTSTRAGLRITTPAGRALRSRMSNLRSGSGVVLLRIGTWKLPRRTPGAKVSVPLVGV